MHQFSVKNTKLIAPSTLLLTLQAKANRDRLSFYPGQYAAIGYKCGGRPSPVRCFSIVSSPNNPSELQFATRVRGNFTRALSQLEAGDSVFVYGPFGNFVIDEAQDRNIILLAGGIGITPFMSIIRYATEAKLAIPISLLYSCSSQGDIPFYNELLELEARNPNLKIAFFVTNGPIDKLKGSRVVTGRVSEAHLNQLTNEQYNRFTHFICGPKSFTASMETIMAAHNTNPERVLTEEFTPTSQLNVASAAPIHSISRWTYSLAGASLVLGTAFFMALDLTRFVPKAVNAQAATSQSQPATSNGNSNNSNNSSTPSSSADNSSGFVNQTSPSQTTQQQNTYQPPVTTVS